VPEPSEGHRSAGGGLGGGSTACNNLHGRHSALVMGGVSGPGSIGEETIITGGVGDDIHPGASLSLTRWGH